MLMRTTTLMGLLISAIFAFATGSTAYGFLWLLLFGLGLKWFYGRS